MLRQIEQAMHVKQHIVNVTIRTTVLDIVAIAPPDLKGTHTSLMVAKVQILFAYEYHKLVVVA